MKYLFNDDYSEGAHPKVLEYLAEHNLDQQTGYGLDDYSQLAAERIKKALQTDGDVHLVGGGTQANLIAAASMLKAHQAIIAPVTSHINIHEAGAIEATGHKILACESKDGKLKPENIERVVAEHMDEHMVKPKAVFLTQATEMGTVYSKSELTDLISTAKKHGLYSYLDGARLGVAVTAASADLTLPEVAQSGIDMLYLGGTKNGALCGEAMVICNPDLRTDFRFHIKQRGGLIAKGRLLGLQFARLFDEDALWLELGQQTNDRAAHLVKRLTELNVSFSQKPETNQLFPMLPDRIINKLQKRYGFYVWEKLDTGTSVIRLVCSWATPVVAIDDFAGELAKEL